MKSDNESIGEWSKTQNRKYRIAAKIWKAQLQNNLLLIWWKNSPDQISQGNQKLTKINQCLHSYIIHNDQVNSELIYMVSMVVYYPKLILHSTIFWVRWGMRGTDQSDR